MTHDPAQWLGFARDILLIAGGAFFGAFVGTGIARRKFSATMVDRIQSRICGIVAEQVKP